MQLLHECEIYHYSTFKWIRLFYNKNTAKHFLCDRAVLDPNTGEFVEIALSDGAGSVSSIYSSGQNSIMQLGLLLNPSILHGMMSMIHYGSDNIYR